MMHRVLVVALVVAGCTPTPDQPDAGTHAPACPEFVLTPPLIDFGCGARGSTTTLPFPDVGATPGALTSPVFTLDDAGLHFTPTDARDFTATIPLFRGECLVGAQSVHGTGVNSTLAWTPNALDFGFVQPGETWRERVTFRSCSRAPLALTDAGITDPNFHLVDAGHSIIPAAVRDDAGVIINGELTLELSFSPTALGPRQGQLRMLTPVAEQSQVVVALRGVGGGPIATLTPTTLDFGAVTMQTTQHATLTNTGTHALFLGLDGGQPYFELTPATCGTVTLGTYDPATGLAGNATATFSIQLTPAAAPRTCTLHVFTTDRANPDVVVTITAQ